MNKAINRYEYSYRGERYTMERVPGGWIISRDRGPHLGRFYLARSRRAAVWYDRIPSYTWTREREAAHVYSFKVARHHWYFLTGDDMIQGVKQ